jgi:hypothetical protein
MLKITYYSAKSIVKIYKREKRIDKKKMQKTRSNQNAIGKLGKVEEQGTEAIPSIPITYPTYMEEERGIICPIPSLWTCSQNLGCVPHSVMWGNLLAKYCN